MDQISDGLKPDLVPDLGATYHTGAIADAVADGPDVIIECTGVASLVFDAMSHVGTGRVVCLTGVSSGGTRSRWTRGCSTGRWCWRTWRWSDRSTPTGATTRRRPRPWPWPTAHGSTELSTARSRWTLAGGAASRS